MYAYSVRTYTYGVGFSVVCSDKKAMLEPKETEQQYCSPAFCLFIMNEPKKISSLSDYLVCVSEAHNIYNPECDLEFRQRHLYYRGQADSSWRICAGLMRNNLVRHEYDMLLDAQNLLWSALKDCKTYLEKIIFFQHYGLPTRLLDVTTNPLVALYFACAEQNDKDGVVYYGYVINDNIDAVDSILKFVFENKTEDFLHEKYNNDIHKTFSEPYFIRPPFNNPRITKQHGEFLIAPLTDKVNRTILLDFEFKQYFEGEIFIPCEYKLAILDELDECGINMASLFLDVEYQLRYIANKYTKKYLLDL